LEKGKLMTKYILLGFAGLLMFSGVDCKHNPVAPSPADTTSHAFTWQTYHLGGAAGSILSDVAIINDTLAYAVGQIYINDSTGQVDQQRYNIALWNGTDWKLQRVPYYYQGQPYYNPIQCVYAFSGNDIWFAGNGVQHWDGAKYNAIDLPMSLWGQNQINKLWGTSDNNLCIGGNGGGISRYDGHGWTKLTSGTTLRINDIWGSSDGSQILAVASELDVDTGIKLLQINGNTVTAFPDSGLIWGISGVWFVPGVKYYVVGDGIHYKHSLQDNIWQGYQPGVVSNYYTGAVRGQGLNDVMFVGAYGEIIHWNGSTFYNYKNEVPSLAGGYGSVAIKGNLVIAVGQDSPSAIAIIGKRQ
jgi:hypothetical protein